MSYYEGDPRGTDFLAAVLIVATLVAVVLFFFARFA
jgi:hypothetical protein